MPFSAVLPILAAAALVPATLAAFRPVPGRRDWVFWSSIGVAAAGPALLALVLGDHGWRTGFAYALWVSIAATAAAFAALAAWDRAAARLAPLLLPYLLVLAVLALAWGHAPEQPLRAATSTWLWVHIAVAVATYALIGIAGVAALAVALQESALRWKRPTFLTRRLPAVAEGDRIAFGALAAATFVLGCGLVSGFVLDSLTLGRWIRLDHKTVLSIAAFLVLAVLLFAHARWGTRGRRGARLALVAWLLLTLGYPGVKFVTDVVLARVAA
ncbi:inner membrane protein YpjD [Stella sp.]|uniref:cytochrome C assembly family protein n=1 Tax=Stella sp. TaxID=2912054 RepID=UPI0035B02D29